MLARNVTRAIVPARIEVVIQANVGMEFEQLLQCFGEFGHGALFALLHRHNLPSVSNNLRPLWVTSQIYIVRHCQDVIRELIVLHGFNLSIMAPGQFPAQLGRC